MMNCSFDACSYKRYYRKICKNQIEKSSFVFAKSLIELTFRYFKKLHVIIMDL